MNTEKIEDIIRKAGFCPINVTAATISPHRSLSQRAEYLRKRLFLTAKRPKDVIILEYNKVTAHLLPPAADDSSRGLVATMYMDSAHVLRGVYQWTKEAAILAYVKPRTCQLRADKTDDETRLCNRPGAEIICETCGFTTCKICYEGTRKRLQCLVCPKPECLVFATAGDMDVSIIRGIGDTHADTYMLHQRTIDQDQLSAETSLPIRVLVHPATPSATKSRIGTGANLLKDTAIQMYLTRPVRKFNVAVVTSSMGKKMGQTGFFDDPSSTFDFLRKQDTLKYTTDTIHQAIMHRFVKDPVNSFAIAVVDWKRDPDYVAKPPLTGVDIFSIHEIAPRYLLVVNGWTCSACGALVAHKTCSQCKVFRFCTDYCAIGNWPEHKEFCQDIALDIEFGGETR